MALEEDDENSGGEQNPHEKLLKQLKFGKILLIVSSVISLIIICIMATGMTVMFMRISELKPPTNEEILTRIDGINEELVRTNDFRRKELLVIVELREMLDGMREDDSSEIINKLSSAMSQREADFQKLIETAQSGTTDLAKMIKGKRDWTKEHNAKLEELLDASKERQKIFSLLSKPAAP
jgi:hypothetical protein